jgi:hypothetical protein
MVVAGIVLVAGAILLVARLVPKSPGDSGSLAESSGPASVAPPGYAQPVDGRELRAAI